MFDVPFPAGSGPRLEACLPNPLRSASIIRYSLERRSRVRLEVYDVGGRRIAVLQDGEREAGAHAFTWNAAAFPSGTYFLTLRSRDASTARRMTIVR